MGHTLKKLIKKKLNYYSIKNEMIRIKAKIKIIKRRKKTHEIIYNEIFDYDETKRENILLIYCIHKTIG